MDLQAIYAALASTLSPNQQERQAAEAALKQQEGQPGYVSALFRVVNSGEVGLEVRQAGIIYFKNLVVKNWDRTQPGEDEGENWVIAEDERQFVRGTILEALVAAHPLCRPQISESLRKIASTDFPEKLPGLLEQIAASLDPAQSPDQIYGALTALRVLTKIYEFKSSDRRQALDVVLQTTFPRLLGLMEATLSAPLGDEKAAEMQKLMIKSFWSSVHQCLPGYLQNGEVFMQWMSLLYRVIEAPVPPQAMGSPDDDKKELASMVFWKCKRWAAQIFHRLFQKYGNPKLAEKQLGEKRQGEVAISRAFHDQLAGQFLNMFMQRLATLAEGKFLPERFVTESINYLQIGVTLAVTWNAMKPNVMALITQVLFPLLCFDEADKELWEDDPNEFIRKQNDIMEDFTSQRVAACNLVIDLCKKRTKTCLVPTLEFCVGHLTAFKEGSGKASTADGAMYCLASLAGPLQDKKVAAQYEQQLMWLLKELVAPLFKSPHGHLRSRAAWTCSQFIDTIVKDPAFYQLAMGEVMTLLKDPELPVKFMAAVALRALIYDHEQGTARENVTELIGGILPQLLQELFNLIDQIGNDELIATMEVLIESFSDQMEPYAQELCQRLSDHFIRLATATGEDGDDESSFAACQCCSAITTLLESVKKTPQLYHSLEPFLVPMLLKVLSPDANGDYNFMEFMEDSLEILTYLTYYSPTISEATWTIFKPLTQSFFDWAFDYLSNINLPLDNYISRCTPRFLQNPENVQIVYKMIEKTLQADETPERDVVEGCKLSESLILNCKGHIDQVIPPLLQLVVNKFRNDAPKKEFCRTELLKMVSNCLYYNPEGTLGALEACGGTGEIFQIWLQALQTTTEAEDDDGNKIQVKTHFKGMHDQKVCILGLSSILRMNPASMPSTVQQGLGHILSALIVLQKEIDENRKRKAAEAERQDDDGDDDDDAALQDFDDDCDEEVGGQEDMDSVLLKLAQMRDGNGTWDDLFGDDEDDEDEYTSPIDDVDEVIYFVECFKALQAAAPDQVQQVAGASLSQDQGTMLQQLIDFAPTRAAELEAKKAQEAQQAAQG